MISFNLKVGQEMAGLFPYAATALHNTVEIADRCHVELTFGDKISPQYQLPDLKVSTPTYLRELCIQGLSERYPNPSEEAVKRLDYELSVIEQMGFSDYFLIVWTL